MTPTPLVRRLTGAAGLAAALSFALPVTPAIACTCAVAPAAAQFDSSGLVFAGLVIGVAPGADAQTVSFEVRSVYKGDPPATAHVSTPASAETCGIQFIENASYLVFVEVDETGYSTSLCRGTTDDLTFLDRAGYDSRDVSITEAAGAQRPGFSESGRVPWLLGAALGIAVVFAAHARRFARTTR